MINIESNLMDLENSSYSVVHLCNMGFHEDDVINLDLRVKLDSNSSTFMRYYNQH